MKRVIGSSPPLSSSSDTRRLNASLDPQELPVHFRRLRVQNAMNEIGGFVGKIASAFAPLAVSVKIRSHPIFIQAKKRLPEGEGSDPERTHERNG
jgi:hypothetical protein